MEQNNKGDVLLQAFFDLLAKDYIEDAVKNLRKSVKEGNLRAMFWLGKIYCDGWLGCQRSLKRATDLWGRSSAYGPSSVLLRQHTIGVSRPLAKLDGPLARALFVGYRTHPDDYDSKYREDVASCKGAYLEYYFLASRCATTEEFRDTCYREGADRGCTQCLIALYDVAKITPWQRRRLWRHYSNTLYDNEQRIMEQLGCPTVLEFGCKENVRHIVCLLEWARKTRKSATLAILPRDVLRLICVRLMRSTWIFKWSDPLIWDVTPRNAKRRKK